MRITGGCPRLPAYHAVEQHPHAGTRCFPRSHGQARRGHGSLVRRLYAQRCRCPPLGIAGQVAIVERVDALAVIALGRLLERDDVGVDRCGFGQQRVSELEADRVMAVLGRGPAAPTREGSIYRLLARGFPCLA